jgi:hypothetical protein
MIGPIPLTFSTSEERENFWRMHEAKFQKGHLKLDHKVDPQYHLQVEFELIISLYIIYGYNYVLGTVGGAKRTSLMVMRSKRSESQVS